MTELEPVWEFLSEKLPAEEFGYWACGNSGLESHLGAQLYEDVIATSYGETAEVGEIQSKLTIWLGCRVAGDDVHRLEALIVGRAARGLLSGALSVAEGTGIILQCYYDLDPREEHFEKFRVFIAFSSETDNLPSLARRPLWNEAVWLQKQEELRGHEDRYRSEVLKASEKLVQWVKLRYDV